MGSLFTANTLTKDKPYRFGFDVAGTIVQVGPGVHPRHLTVGDQVYAMTSFTGCGTVAEYVDIDQQYVAMKPKNLSYDEAASVPLVGLTSYQALFEYTQLKSGANQGVLILGGSGATGMYAIQFAKLAGAHVTVTESTKNAALLKSLGADVVIDYHTQKWLDAIAPHSIDIIYDCGVEPNAWSDGAQSILKKETGEFVTLLNVENPIASQFGATNLGGVLVFPSGRHLQTIAKLFDDGKFKAIVDSIVSLDKALDGVARVKSRRAVGKVVVKVRSKLSGNAAPAMGRHHRRGYVGQTNVPSPHKHDHHASPEREPRKLPIPSPTSSTHSRKRQLRAKWKLDLAPMPRGLDALHEGRTDGQERESPEAMLAASIEAVQHDRKSFKDEAWYRSPIGAGSKSSVILAALKQQDDRDTGFLPRASIVGTLQHPHFGLSEGEIHKLLRHYDPAQEQIHYKTFVQHLHFTERPALPDDRDIVFRHERYLEKIRDHATRLVENSHLSPSAAAALSPFRLSPLKRENTINGEPGVVVGNSPSPSRRPVPLVDGESPSPTKCDDRLSFEFDKQRRAERANAKAAKLLAHISRIEEYARRQDVVAIQQDSLRIATKAIHNGEHLAHVFDQQQRYLHRLENQGKALLDSALTTTQRNVSKDSMFYVDPRDRLNRL